MRLALIFLLLISPAFAVTKHVAQTAAGTADGSTAGNAYGVAAFNAGTTTPTFTPAGDDIVILDGTFTTQLVPPSSGTSGHPITYQFASAAKFSTAAWGADASSAVVISGKNYITIDGNSVGIIECTANGDSLANKQFSDGVYVLNSTNWIVKNITIRNIYVHTYGTPNNPTNLAYNVNCIKAVDSSAGEVSNCTLTNAYTAVLYEMTVSGTQTGPNVHGNTMAACSTGEFCASSNAGQTLTGTIFAYNDVTMGLNWYEVADLNHIDGYHTGTGTPGDYGSMPNTNTYGNYIHGDCSPNCSGFIYYSDVTSGSIYNNVLICGPVNHPNQGYIYLNLAGTTSQTIASNTIVGFSNTNTGSNGIDYDGHTGISITATVKDNIISTCYVAVVDAQNQNIWSSDYNTYYNVGSVGSNGSFQTTLANWQAITGGDTHSTVSNPNLNGSFVPVATSGAIATGVSLSGTFTTGLSIGATWPNPATATRATTWDMGAFIVTTSGSAPTYSSGAINTAGSTLSVTYSASCTTGVGGNGGVTIAATGGAVTPTYSSGSGSATYVYTLSRTINAGETVTTSYTQPGAGIAATSGGTDVASYSTQPVTNNSTQGTPTSSSSVSGKVSFSGSVQIK